MTGEDNLNYAFIKLHLDAPPGRVGTSRGYRGLKLMKRHVAAEKLTSLFLVSLPRSLSGIIYHAIRRSVRLNAPAWTTDGEVLNLDRFALLPLPHESMGLKFITPALEPKKFAKV